MNICRCVNAMFDPYSSSHWHEKCRSFMIFRSFVVFLNRQPQAHSKHFPSFCRAFGVVRYDSQKPISYPARNKWPQWPPLMTHFSYAPEASSGSFAPPWFLSLANRSCLTFPAPLALYVAVFWGRWDQWLTISVGEPLKKMNWTFHAVKGWVGIFLNTFL